LISERDEQISLHQWCKLKKLNSFSVPNGGSRHRLEAINLKREGATAGVSDYVVLLKDKILFIEMKRRPKKLVSGKMSVSHTKTSVEQLKFLDELKNTSYAIGKVCYGFAEAKEFIEDNL